MKNLLMGLACTAMLMESPVFAQNSTKTDSNQDQTSKQQQNRNDAGQQQTIRGTVVGVTSVGEALIDPQTNTAVMVEKDYLTVLGTATGQRGQQNRAQGNQPGRTQAQFNRTDRSVGQGNPDQADDNDRQRQNLYLVAITPETKVHKQSGQRGTQQQATSDNAQDQNSREHFEQLEIGDRVMVRFASTERLHAKADSKNGEQRTTAFRGDPNSRKHGRDRIFVGEASEIAIMAGQGDQRGQNQNREGRNDRNRRNNASESTKSQE
ncbi:MAG: hypothetical protein KDA84_08810 [Planctomycetaceae bacterium]|nr:hypothetical protein [Planctomycetaceae bacterium]